jgi:hypothetical protein
LALLIRAIAPISSARAVIRIRPFVFGVEK